MTKISWDTLEAIGKHLQDGKPTDDPIFRAAVDAILNPIVDEALKEAAAELEDESKPRVGFLP